MEQRLKGMSIWFGKLFVALVMMSMVLMVFLNAVLRYTMNGGIPEAEELSRFAFVWVSALGAVLAYYHDRHIGVDVFIRMLAPLPKFVARITAEILVVIALLAMIQGGMKYFTNTAHLESAALPIPMGVITITALVIAILMLPKTGMNIMKHLRRYKTEKES